MPVMPMIFPWRVGDPLIRLHFRANGDEPGERLIWVSGRFR